MNEQYVSAPHRRSGSRNETTSPNAALLIDFDNVTMGIRSNLGTELRNLLESDVIRGKVAVQRAYADWRRYPQYIVPLSEASIDLIFAPAYGSSKKNATDIRLAIDALELVFTRPEIGVFILLSGDSDFSSLVLKLKEYGKYVIGVGMQESSSDLLVQNCDEYYSYNRLGGLTSAAEMETVKHDPWELASRAIRKMVDRGDVMRSDRFKQVMLELDSGFDEKELGYSKFNRFLTEAASRGIVELQKAANGQYEVSPGGKAVKRSSSGAVAERSHGGGAERSRGGGGRARDRSGRDRGRRGGSRREARSEAAEPAASTPEVDENRLRTAYRLLADVVADLAEPGDPVRDSEVKRQMLERDGSFDEAALGFKKFSRFLRQAHDEDVVVLQRGPEGNYLVAPIGSDGGAAGATADEGRAPADEDRAGRDRRGGRGRGRGRERGSRGEERPARREAETPTGAEAPEEPEAEPEAGVRAAEAEERVETETAVGSAAARTPEEDRPEAPAARGRRGLGRFRRGSRAPSPAPPKGPGVVPGPVDADAGEQTQPRETEAPSSEPSEPEPSETETRAAAPAAGKQERTAGPAHTGASPRRRRGRRGSRGPRPSAPSTAAATDEPSATAGGDEPLVERMARNYPGVGRKTAERLIDEFGDEVIEVIDTAPDRVRSVLPEHRARAVIEGRAAEREGDGS